MELGNCGNLGTHKCGGDDCMMINSCIELARQECERLKKENDELKERLEK